MATTNVNIRMDKELKRQFEEFCTDMGMTMTTAFNIFAKKVVMEDRIPFEIGREKPNKETLAAMEECERIAKDPSLTKTYHSAEEMMKDILGDV